MWSLFCPQFLSYIPETTGLKAPWVPPPLYFGKGRVGSSPTSRATSSTQTDISVQGWAQVPKCASSETHQPQSWRPKGVALRMGGDDSAGHYESWVRETSLFPRSPAVTDPGHHVAGASFRTTKSGWEVREKV